MSVFRRVSARLRRILKIREMPDFGRISAKMTYASALFWLFFRETL
jgi:hypothetical protein